MIKLVKRSPRNKASKAKLLDRIAYISDDNHPDHLKKTILPARSYNCPSQTPEAFASEVLRLDSEYTKARVGRQGNRSLYLFEEVIYSSPHGGNLPPLERESVEFMIIKKIGRTTACRTAWHIDSETGRADLHILLAAKNNDYPPKVTLWADFGGTGGRHIYAEFDRLDVEITAFLNSSPTRTVKLKSADKIRKDKATAIIGKKPTLASEVAFKRTVSITRENLTAAIEKLGHTITKVTENLISVVFKGAKKPRRYNIAELLAGIAAEQELNLEHTKSHTVKPPMEGPTMG